jgi:ABC-type branched-subunit amino acid transport system permease subunit
MRMGDLKKVATVGATIGGVAGILTGVACLVTHFAAGDLSSHFETCMAMVIGGAGVFSPGLNSMKVGLFARPGKK